MVAGIRNPEYTGENRCWPCTVLNGIVLGAVCGLLALSSPPAAVLTGLAGLALLRWRGYLVPFTPRFAPRLVARLPWNPFHEPTPEPGTLADGAASPDPESVLAALVDAGVLTDDDELAPTENFRGRWTREMRSLRELDDDALADEALAVSPGAGSASAVSDEGRRYVVLSDGTDDPANEQWLRRPNAIAETAAARALTEFDVPEAVHPQAASALKTFLETCPGCGGAVAERPAGSCCGAPVATADGRAKRAIACESCDVHFHVFD